MTYDQAQAYCFSKHMWLAKTKEGGPMIDGILRSLTPSNTVWYDSWRATEDECWNLRLVGSFDIPGVKPGYFSDPVNCGDNYYAVCQTGQIEEKSCTAWPLAPLKANKQSKAQEYCEYARGNLPFFNNKKELAAWQNRPNPKGQEWLGIVRNDKFNSGWAKVTGDEATVFAWNPNYPVGALDVEDCAITGTRDPLAWIDVSCTSSNMEIFRCRIDTTVYVWDDCHVPELPEPPKIAIYYENLSGESHNVLLSPDGSKIIEMPSSGHRQAALHAIIRGTVYIFGGYETFSDAECNKISKLFGNQFVDVPYILPMKTINSGQAISIRVQTKALICNLGTCQIYDETSLTNAPSLEYEHTFGCIAEYQGNPNIVGGVRANGAFENALSETFIDGNWVARPELADIRVEDTYSSACFGLDDGSFLKAGGHAAGDFYVKSVWLLKEGKWSKLGEMSEGLKSAYNLQIGRFFYMAAYRRSHTKKLYRLEIKENTLLSTESIYEDEYAIGMLILQ